jgi:Fe-S-cluster containining protein
MSVFSPDYIDFEDYQNCLNNITKKICSILGDKKNKTRASDSAAYMLDSFDLTLDKNTNNIPQIDCKKGCSICCTLYVSARIPEILYLSRHIKEQTQDAKRIIEKIENTNLITNGLNKDERFDVSQDCSMLENHACQFYKARPLPCRTLASDDLKTCEKCVKKEQDYIITPDIHTMTRAALDMAMWAGLKVNNLSHESYELNQALLIAMKNDKAEKQWLKGKDVFKKAEIDNSDDTTGMMPNDFHIDILIAMALSS